MEKELIALFLCNEFYEAHKAKITKEMFSDELLSIWETISYAQEKFKRDISWTELKALFRELNPTLSRAAKNVIFDELDSIAETSGRVQSDIGEELLRRLQLQVIGRQVASLGLSLVEGQSDDPIRSLDALRLVLEQSQSNTAQGPDVLAGDFDSILAGLESRPSWKFNLPSLAEKVGGIGPGDFAVIFARPEAGKTAFYVSLVAAPNGFAWQGAKVVMITNEEPGIKTQLRMISAATGMTLEQVDKDRVKAKDIWANIKDKLVVVDDATLSMADLDQIVDQEKPDIIIVDQLDKVDIKGTFARTDERLQDLYIEFRKLIKKHNIAGIGITQCGAEGDGKTVLTFGMMDNSKTGKAANCDLIVGIGKPNMEDGTENNVRHIYLSKNKINGWHGKVLALLRPELSRYTN